MRIKKLIFWMVMANSTTFVFASSDKDWFDAPLKDCFEAIEEGKFLARFNTKVSLVVPVEYVWTSKDLQKKYANKRNTKTCGVTTINYFYDDREYSLNRVRESYTSGGTTYYCPKLNAKSYAFCEYAKFKSVKGVRPFY